MRVDIEKTVPAAIQEKPLKRLIEKVLQREGRPNTDVTVVFTDDARIKDLNWRFRGKERVTDVIAFSMRGIQERDPSGSLLGDIYISVPQARAQAKDYGVTEEEEIRRLVVHGVLHVLGYDDAEKGQARKMRQHEDQHLEKSEAGNRARSGRRSRQHSRDA